jgi:hypothetical protein
MAIHARAVDIAQKMGVTVGDVIEIDRDNESVDDTKYYLGTIDLGENITKKVVPETITKIYVSFEGNNNDFFTMHTSDGNTEIINIPNNHKLLTDSERIIRQN